MNVIEAAKFLTISTALTGKETTEQGAIAWSAVLGDIPMDEALAAMRAHYRMSRFPVMPADIVDQVNQAHARTKRGEQRAIALRRKRASNAQHRQMLLADGRELRDEDVVWPDVGWTGDDQPDVSLTSSVPAATIASRSA